MTVSQLMKRLEKFDPKLKVQLVNEDNQLIGIDKVTHVKERNAIVIWMHEGRN